MARQVNANANEQNFVYVHIQRSESHEGQLGERGCGDTTLHMTQNREDEGSRGPTIILHFCVFC